MIKDMMKVDTNGKRVGNSYEGELGTLSDDAITVGTVYGQVVGTLSVMVALQVTYI